MFLYYQSAIFQNLAQANVHAMISPTTKVRRRFFIELVMHPTAQAIKKESTIILKNLCIKEVVDSRILRFSSSFFIASSLFVRFLVPVIWTTIHRASSREKPSIGMPFLYMGRRDYLFCSFVHEADKVHRRPTLRTFYNVAFCWHWGLPVSFF